MHWGVGGSVGRGVHRGVGSATIPCILRCGGAAQVGGEGRRHMTVDRQLTVGRWKLVGCVETVEKMIHPCSLISTPPEKIQGDQQNIGKKIVQRLS